MHSTGKISGFLAGRFADLIKTLSAGLGNVLERRGSHGQREVRTWAISGALGSDF